MLKITRNTLNMAEKTIKSLASVENSLNLWLKPNILAEKWDNVGLLVGSGLDSKDKKIIHGILLCNDMTPEVVREAVDKKLNLIISYHPPIFSPLKAIAYGSWKEEIIAKCLANDISVYSPHTALDAISGGINDRVMDALASYGSKDSPVTSKAIIPSTLVDISESGFKFLSSHQSISKLFHSLALDTNPGVAVAFDIHPEDSSASLRLYCSDKSIYERIEPQIQFLDLGKPMEAAPAAFGAGRIIAFKDSAKLIDVVSAIKANLNLAYLQIAYGKGKNENSEVNSAAVCVGSGASLLKGVPADVYITGEMSHHDILDCVQLGVTVLLCGHCQSERHYLPTLEAVVRIVTGVKKVFVSETDQSPLTLLAV